MEGSGDNSGGVDKLRVLLRLADGNAGKNIQVDDKRKQVTPSSVG